MSRRAPANEVNATTKKIQEELNALKETARQASHSDSIAAALPESSQSAPSFDQLVPVEQAAASLGVHPEAWKPIGFLNNMHYENLIKQNALDDELARRIEVSLYINFSLQKIATNTQLTQLTHTGVQGGGHFAVSKLASRNGVSNCKSGS